MKLFRRVSTAVRAAAAAFEAWTDRYGAVVSFAVLFGGLACSGYHAPLAQAAQDSCGAICLAMPGFYWLAAAAWGGVAVLAAMVYARLLDAFQRRSERKKLLAWFGWLVLGWAVAFFPVMRGTHAYADPGLALGWYMGGPFALDYLWSKRALEQTSSPDA